MRRFPHRDNIINWFIPPVVTMFVSGMWHGFSWHVLLWGGIHGIYLVMERLLNLKTTFIPQNILGRVMFRRWIMVIVVFILVLLAWVPFSMAIPVAIDFWVGMFFNWTNWELRFNRIVLTIPLIITAGLIDFIQYRSKDELLFYAGLA